MSVDPTTEFISHFIGIFSLTSEQVRMRLEYEEFAALTSQDVEPSELLNVNIQIRAPYHLRDYVPDLKYTPADHYIVPLYVYSNVFYNFPEIYVPFDYFDTGGFHQFPFFSGGGGSNTLLIPPNPPGSLAVVLKQANYLEDNDYYSNLNNYTGYGFGYNHGYALDYLIAQANVSGFRGTLSPPSSEEAIPHMVGQIEIEARDYAVTVEKSENVSIFSEDEIIGVHVNGEIVSTPPLLADYLPAAHQEQTEADEDTQDISYVEGGKALEFASGTTLEAGANILMNQVTITSVWNSSAVLAVTGDSHDLNLISQLNIWNDTDQTYDMLMNNITSSTNQTQAYNIALVTLTAQNLETDFEEQGDELVFPAQWAVTRLDANLVYLNWVEQTNFVSDSDIHVLSCSGSETLLVTGGNTVTNSLSFFDLGLQYDLIVVGGNYYNANVILQTNIMLDNDFLYVEGEENSDFNFSASGNLLWNQATIESFGSTDFDALPDNFMQLAESLSTGSDLVGQDILNDAIFAGLLGLNILYIDGDILDFQYINQTNILGDSDEVSILANEYAENSDIDWEISTGNNAIINVATIVDVGPDATVLVGGEQYSDELIFQAELVPDIPMNTNDNDLVSEAVVFLVDDMLETENVQNPVPHAVESQNTSDVDLMQTMLS